MVKVPRYSIIVIFGKVLSHKQTLVYIGFQVCDLPHKDWDIWLINKQLYTLEKYNIVV